MKIYRIKRIPKEIENWFKRYLDYNKDGIYTKSVYKYEKIYYGVEIWRNGQYWDNSHQGTLEKFVTSMDLE